MSNQVNFAQKAYRRNMHVAVLLVFLLVSTFASAQLPTATIFGVVKDSSGAVVPEVGITARNLETGQSRTAVSDGSGSYRFAALPVGAYEIRAEHPGFQTAIRTGLTLSVGRSIERLPGKTPSCQRDQ